MENFIKKCLIVSGLVVVLMFLFFFFCPWRYDVHTLRGEGTDRANTAFVVDRLFNTVRVVVYDKTKGAREVINFSF